MFISFSRNDKKNWDNKLSEINIDIILLNKI